MARKTGDNFVHSLVEHEARQSMMLESRVAVEDPHRQPRTLALKTVFTG